MAQKRTTMMSSGLACEPKAMNRRDRAPRQQDGCRGKLGEVKTMTRDGVTQGVGHTAWTKGECRGCQLLARPDDDDGSEQRRHEHMESRGAGQDMRDQRTSVRGDVVGRELHDGGLRSRRSRQDHGKEPCVGAVRMATDHHTGPSRENAMAHDPEETFGLKTSSCVGRGPTM